jgi:hypothetical protein
MGMVNGSRTSTGCLHQSFFFNVPLLLYIILLLLRVGAGVVKVLEIREEQGL